MKSSRNYGGARRIAPLLGAMALHAIVILLGRGQPAEPSVGVSGPAPVASELDIDLSELARVESEPPPSASEAANAANADQGPFASNDSQVGGRSSTVRSHPEVSTALTGSEPPSGAQSEPGRGYALDPAAPESGKGSPHVDLGIDPGSWGKWGNFAAPPAETAEPGSRTPRPVSSTGGLAEALDAQDRKVGIGPSGAALSAARDAALGEAAPRSGVAQFAVTVYQDGSIDVALVASSSEAAGWSSVGSAMAASLRRKPPRIASTRRGVRMLIEVAAQERRASGAPSEGEKGHITPTPPKLQSSEAAKAEIERSSPGSAPAPGAVAEQRPLAPIMDAPGVFATSRGRLGQVAVGVGAFGEVDKGDPGDKVAGGLVVKGNVDVVDLVSRASRAISTRVLRETIL